MPVYYGQEENENTLPVLAACIAAYGVYKVYESFKYRPSNSHSNTAAIKNNIDVGKEITAQEPTINESMKDLSIADVHSNGAIQPVAKNLNEKKSAPTDYDPIHDRYDDVFDESQLDKI